MGKTTILVNTRFTVPEDRCVEFEVIVSELGDRTEYEPGALMYRFYRGRPGHYSVIEEYEDADAVFAHQAGNQDLLTRAAFCPDHIATQIHGPVGPAIRAWAQSDPTVMLYEDLL